LSFLGTIAKGKLMNRQAGLFVVAGGICLVLVGLLIYSGGLNWFGSLPGDIRYEGEHTRVYIPIVSMLIVSLALTLILNLVRRFF
jgi:Protein of unknown function (DUF2905)